jgi:exosortase
MHINGTNKRFTDMRLIFALMLIASMAAAFYPTFSWMFERFLEPDSQYSHGFLIPLASAFLIWGKRKELAKLPAGSSIWGLFLLIFGLILHIISWSVFKIGFVSGISFIITIYGLCLYLIGPAKMKAIAFPLVFLVFMVPLPKVALIGITFKLKMLAASSSSLLISLTPLKLIHAGSMFYLPGGEVLAVGNECSGINSLISIITLSVFLAYLGKTPFFKRILFIVLSIPVAVAANVCRIMFLIVAAYIYGVAATLKSILHLGAGITLWMTALAMMAGIWRLVNWDPKKL